MDRSNVLTLISKSYEADDYGVMQPQEVKHDVFCNVTSVSLTEWSEGGRLGLNPEYRFILFLYDYQQEEVCEFNGVRYAIYRTYVARDDTIELYAERREGV